MNPTEHVPPFQPEAVPVRPGRATLQPYQLLPHVPVGQVTGLVEHLHAHGDRADIYALGREFQMEVDDLLPLVQAIDWSRYAELFAYDDQEGLFYRETETPGAEESPP